MVSDSSRLGFAASWRAFVIWVLVHLKPSTRGTEGGRPGNVVEECDPAEEVLENYFEELQQRWGKDLIPLSPPSPLTHLGELE